MRKAILLNALPISSAPSFALAPTVLFSDAHIVVAVKPAGLLSVPGRGPDKQDCFSARLAQQLGNLHIVHRLDQATSGLMIFAKTLEALRHLHTQFREGTVHKTYEAIVLGRPALKNFSIDDPIAPDWPHRPLQMIDRQRGKPALTHVQVLSVDSQAQTARLRLLPITGRTHQLRVHLASRGYPILGDSLYGKPSNIAVHSASVLFAPVRLMLHATAVTFIHPSTQININFENAAPF